MLFIQSIILGIVQGLTEFIPISSSAHLIIVPWLFGWNDPVLKSLSFDVALHLGTLLAVLSFFATDWVRLLRAGVASLVERKVGDDFDRRFAWLLVIGCIPGGIVGVIAESKITKLFHQPNSPIHVHAIIAMAVIIALLAAVMFTADRMAKHVRGIKAVTFKDTLIIGLAQACAIFPGVSRSGATITAGLAMGFEREAAARFSFMLSAPIIAGAGMKSLLELYKVFKTGALTSAELMLFPIGFVTSAVTGYLCIKFLLRFLQRNSTDVFVYYRWMLALVIVIVALVRG
ncbi:MAG: undecaprenyl-diphosphatase UppP [Chitinispirillaceae bacterium]|jgi:undecaprenyl-diphosphatase